MRRRSGRLRILAALLALACGCSSFSLSEQSGPLAVPEHRRAGDATLAILPFSFAPGDPEETDRLSAQDLARWQQLLASGLEQTNIASSVIAAPGGEVPADADYTLGGRITRFEFRKNWVPTFFPIHLLLSFFTFTGYTLCGGPTHATVVHFSADFELQDARSGGTLGSFSEDFDSRQTVNIYSNASENPYDNPNLVFSRVVDSAAAKIASALP